MSMTANKVLDRAEQLGMLDPKVIADLRRQVAESKFHVTPEAIVKILVDKKHLTPFQAKKLVAEVTIDEEPTSTAKARETVPSAKARPASNSEDDLLAGFGESPSPSVASKPAEEEEIVDLEEALPPSQPLKAEVKPIASTKPAKSQPAKGPKTPVSKPAAWKNPPPPSPSASPGLTPLAPSPTPGLTPLAPAPTPGLTPIGPSAPPPALTPISPATPGLTPLAPAVGASSPGLTPVDRAVPAPAGLSPTPSQPSPGHTPLGPAPLGNADPMMGDALSGLGVLAPPPPPPEEKGGRQKKLAMRWDSPLFLMGYAGLGVLVIAFIALYLAIFRGSATQLLADANDKYEGGQYAGAIAQYEKYVKSYPDEASVPYARLMIRASRIHQPYDGKDYNSALKVAQRELPEMEKEADVFDQFRGELESILPTIADHFATAARTATDLKKMEEQVALAHDAMQLVNNASYLPTARRESQQARIDDIMEKIRVAERTINQGKALADAMTALQGKLKANDIKGAYDIRAKLLQDYPTLQSHSEVVKNTLAISQRERDLVTTEPQTQPAATDDPHLPSHQQVALVQRSGEAIGAPEGSVAYLLIRGTVYAIDVAPGKLLWQRSVGTQTRIGPLPVGGDVIVSDQQHHEVLRLAGKTGEAIWRQSFGEAMSAPQSLDDHLFITLESGRVLRLNAANGEIDRAAQLPQAAAVAAAPVSAGTDAKGKVLYQAAEHSTIFALSADDSNGEPLTCRSAYYLGHRPGSIAVPPMVVVGYVFVFQNEGAASSLVHALAVKKDGTLEPAREPIRLRGRVTIPPISLRSRLVAVSDLGDILVADIDPGNSDSPVNITAHKPGGLSQPTIGYPLIAGSRLFVADTRLADYEIVATKQDLAAGDSQFPGDAFVAPLQLFGNTLVHARQRSGMDSVTVTGVNLSDKKSWEIAIASPMAGVNVLPQQRQFAAVNSDGTLFDVGVDMFAAAVRDQPTATLGGATADSFVGSIPLAEGKALLWTRSGIAWGLQDVQAGGNVQRVTVQTDQGDRLSAQPAAFGEGILAPMSRGAVWLLDPATGAPLGGTTPFLPETAPGTLSRWLPPLAVDERQFVAIDTARKSIYLARREEKPMPYLAQSKLLEVDYEPAYAALLEKALLVVARGDTEDEIVAFSLPSLQETKRLPIKARVGARGLEVVGNHAFCQTSAGDLLKISAAPELVSSTPLGQSLLAAPPLPSGNDLLLVAQNGQVLRMSGESSEVQAVANAGQPLTGAVQLVGGNLLAGGVNGTLHLLPLGGAAKEAQP